MSNARYLGWLLFFTICVGCICFAHAADDEQDRNRAACKRIANSIDMIHSKQRAGYRAKEGVRMDERLRQLEEERRARRCR